MSNELITLKLELAVQTELNSAVLAAEDLAEVTDAVSYEAAHAADVRINKAVKAVAAARLDMTRKLDAVKASIMKQEKEIIEEAVQTQEIIAKALADYDTKLAIEKAERERAAKLAEEQMAKQEAEAGTEYITPPLAPVLEPEYDAPKRSTRQQAVLIIDDEAAIPRQFMNIDEKRVKKALEAGIAVPGARLVYEEVRVRR